MSDNTIKENFQKGNLVIPFVQEYHISVVLKSALKQKLNDAATCCFIALMDQTFQGETLLGGIQGMTL